MSKPRTLSDVIREQIEEEQKKEREQLQNDNDNPTQIIHQQKQNLTGEEQAFVSYINIGISQTVTFFQSIFGTRYKPQNNFGFDSKQKVIRYVFTKNMALELELQKFFKERKFQDKSNLKYKLEESEQLLVLNRVKLIQGFIDSRNRLGVMGYSWGAFLASLIHLTVIKNLSYWKKLAVWVTIFHCSGQVINYINIDRIFDKVYPFFEADLKNYFKKEKEKRKKGLDRKAGEVYIDDMELMMRQYRIKRHLEEMKKP